MNTFAILAIYMLFWVISAFVVLPFGLRTPDETGDVVTTGHADSAPVNFKPLKVMLRATILSAVLFGLYYENYEKGWVTSQNVEKWVGVPR
jgi:predicted secreted protein